MKFEMRCLLAFSLLFLGANCQFPDAINYDWVEPECKQQLDAMFKHPGKEVAQMLDAWAILPSGILVGNTIGLGNFDECLGIDFYPEGSSTRIIGQYCGRGINTAFAGVPVGRAICIPDKCKPKMFDSPVSVTADVLCQTKESHSKWNAADYSVLGVLCLVAFLMVISTIYDAILQRKGLKPPHPSVLSFSILTNGKKILATSNNPDQLHCLNGIRCISIVWVIAGHRFASIPALSIINGNTLPEWKTSTYSAYIQGARVAVDTFFFLSAFLISYSYFKSKKPMTLKDIPIFYFHRLFRITPALAALYMVQVTLLTRATSGPLWYAFEAMRETCLDNWWSFFLYVQNYVHYKNMCIVPSWYLSADMQMFIVAPFVILPLGFIRRKDKKMGYIAATALIIVSIIVPMTVDFFRENLNEYETHTRLSVYTIGILFGMFVIDVRNKKNTIHTLLNLAIWAIAIIAMLACIWHTWYVEDKKTTDFLRVNMHNTITRPMWTLALCWIVYSCITGSGGFVNWLLSRPMYQVMAKISYSMYLLHNPIITYNLATLREEIYFSDYFAIYTWCGDVIFTVVAATIWVLAFESPMIGIEKLIFGVPAKRAPVQEKKLDDVDIAIPSTSRG